MTIAIGSDHAGYEMKDFLAAHLRDAGHTVLDLGGKAPEPCDYPLVGEAVGRAVADGKAARGVLICGTGIGISIAANKVRGVRCAACSEPFSAAMSRRHNDANILALGARVVAPQYAAAILDAFMAAEFEGERHARRVGQLAEIERQG